MTDSVKTVLDRANPNTLPDHMREIKLGQTLGSDVKQTVRKFNMNAAGADPYNLGTLDCMKLPNDAKAISILRAFGRSVGGGGGTTGELAPQAFAATPIDGQIAVSPCGDIVTVTSAKYTSIDVEYMAARGDVLELTLPVVADEAVFPTSVKTQGVAMLLEAESLVGAVTGKFIVVKESDSKPGTTKWANLKMLRESVLFKATDAVTKCRVKLLLCASTDLKSTLASDAATI